MRYHRVVRCIPNRHCKSPNPFLRNLLIAEYCPERYFNARSGNVLSTKDALGFQLDVKKNV